MSGLVNADEAHDEIETFTQKDALKTLSERVVFSGDRKQPLVQALLSPHWTPPAYALQDAYEIYVKRETGWWLCT